MDLSACFLRPDALAEPLVDRWFALPHRIPPALRAMIVATSDLPLLASYLEGPGQHFAAARNPQLAGGPFVRVDPARADEVRGLQARTTTRSAGMVELARAIGELHALLAREARGRSLAPLYPKVPDALRGLVELGYDLRHSPSVRFLEGLVYRSRFYDESIQEIALGLDPDDDRPLVMTTPRLEGDDLLFVARPFRDPAWDDLFALRDRAGSAIALRERLGIADADAPRFERLFTDAPSGPAPRYDGPGTRLRFFGHACVLLETRDVAILTDPLLGLPSAGGPARFSYGDLPARLDYVLITHAHADHLVLESLLQLRHKIGTVIVPRAFGDGLADPSLRLILERIGFPSIVELGELESVPVPGGEVTGVPFLGEHCDLPIRAKLGHHVRLGAHTVLAAADSTTLEPRVYDQLRALLGRLDVLLIGTESVGAP